MPPPLNGIYSISQNDEKGKRKRWYTIGKKMGRPKVDKPKEIKYSIRTDAETERRLEEYCKATGISKGEAYRKGIEKLLAEAPAEE